MELKTLFQADDDRAVSPVIGVILMVAITVILAAVIGTFVLGLGDDIEQEVNAGATINEDANSVTVTWTSQGNADELEVLVTDEDDNEEEKVLGSVGASTTVTNGDEDLTEGDDYQVTVIAIDTSGSEDRRTVVQTRTVNLD